MKKIQKFLIGIISLFFMIFSNTMGLSAIENSIGLNNGRLRAYIYVTPYGGYWESSARYSGSYGVAYLGLESNVTGSGYWRVTGSSTYAEDEGVNAARQGGSYSRAYAYNRSGGRVGGVATSIY